MESTIVGLQSLLVAVEGTEHITPIGMGNGEGGSQLDGAIKGGERCSVSEKRDTIAG